MRKLLFVTNLTHDDRAEDLFLADLMSERWAITITGPAEASVIAEPGAYDVALIRNAWPSYEFDAAFSALEGLMAAGRLRTYNPPSISRGFRENKTYLAHLYRDGYAVIPTWLTPDGMREAGYQDQAPAVFKPLDGCSSLGVVFDDFAALPTTAEGVFQPAMRFEYEVSLFFIDAKFAYAIRSAGPGIEQRWQLAEYQPSDYDLCWAQSFVEWNGLQYGIQRIDGGRTNDGKLWLTEVEDFLPYLSLDALEPQTKGRIVKTLLDSVGMHLDLN